MRCHFRYIQKIQPIPEDGAELLLKQRHIGLHKRGSGASLETEALITSLDGQTVYYRLVSGGFMVGAKGFEDCGTSNSEKVETPSEHPTKFSEPQCPHPSPLPHMPSGSGSVIIFLILFL